MEQSVDFINPSHKWGIYGSVGYLALAVGTLFTRHQAVKIIGATVLSVAAHNTAAAFFNTLVHTHSERDVPCNITPDCHLFRCIGL